MYLLIEPLVTASKENAFERKRRNPHEMKASSGFGFWIQVRVKVIKKMLEWNVTT